jgi:LmbE family N-acetylglucosaminyl deacetylase
MGNIIRKIKNSRKIQVLILLTLLVIVIVFYSYFRANPVMPQLTIYFLDDVKLPEQGQTLLVFSPHPDDETIACGGYIIESVRRGAEVYIILVTDGNRRNLRDMRYLEFESATCLLGVPCDNLIYLDYPDSRLAQQNQLELQQVFKEIIQEYKPDILLYSHPEDNHIDHSTTGIIIENILEEMLKKYQTFEKLEELEDLMREEVVAEMDSLEKIIQDITAYKYLVHHRDYPHPKRYAPDLFMLPPLDLVTLEGGWERFMLSEEIKQQKERALRAYITQLRNPLLKNLLEASIRENEIFAVYQYEN